MTGRYDISTDRLTKRYGNVSAVDGLSLRVPVNGITGFLGQNGAGKSSTIKMLLGIIRPTSGTASVLGAPIDQLNASCAARRRIAYVAEDKDVYPYFTVEQAIWFARSFYQDWDRDAEQRLLTRYALPPARKVKSLSRGMRTKLALLFALARRPRLLILDEPSDGLDPVSVEELLQSLTVAASEGATIFFSSHRIDEVERIADRVCIIDQGRLKLDADMDSVREQCRRITVVFREPIGAGMLAGDGVEHVACHGRQLTVTVSRNADPLVARAHALGAVSIDIHPISLRDLFLSVIQVSGDAPVAS
jgi:ABC-2 type transport system ATP-binding protein